MIPEGEELSVVIIIVQMVIHVVSRTVDDRLENFRDSEIAVVDGDRPDVDEDKQEEIGEFVEGEKKGVDVVGDAL